MKLFETLFISYRVVFIFDAEQRDCTIECTSWWTCLDLHYFLFRVNVQSISFRPWEFSPPHGGRDCSVREDNEATVWLNVCDTNRQAVCRLNPRSRWLRRNPLFLMKSITCCHRRHGRSSRGKEIDTEGRNTHTWKIICTHIFGYSTYHIESNRFDTAPPWWEI